MGRFISKEVKRAFNLSAEPGTRWGGVAGPHTGAAGSVRPLLHGGGSKV